MEGNPWGRVSPALHPTALNVSRITKCTYTDGGLSAAAAATSLLLFLAGYIYESARSVCVYSGVAVGWYREKKEKEEKET